MKIIKNEKSILIEFTDLELSILADGIADPLAHFEIVAAEKLSNCKSQLKSFWIRKFDNEKTVESIPTAESELLSLIFGQPDYKNKAARDEQEKLKIKS